MKRLTMAAVCALTLMTACDKGVVQAEPVVSSAPHVELTDIANHWGREAIEKAVGNGVVDGYEDGSFQPDRHVSRGEFAKMVASSLKLPIGDQVDGSDWYLPYANAVVGAGIHHWSDFTDGDWNTPITRQEMARMVVRASQDEMRVGDHKDTELMYTATKTGLIQGLDKGELGIDQPTTRAQSVTVIDRILTVKDGGKLEVDKYAQIYAELAMNNNNIQTMWGMKGYDLPMEIDAGSEVKAVVDRYMIVDMEDENAPYREWFKDVIRTTDMQSLDKDYLIAFHVNVTNISMKPNDPFLFYSFRITAPTPYARGGILVENLDKTPVQEIPTFLPEGEVDGWFLSMISKQYVHERIGKKRFEGLYLGRVNLPGKDTIRFSDPVNDDTFESVIVQ